MAKVKNRVKIWLPSALCIAGSLGLFLALTCFVPTEGPLENGCFIRREEYGGEARNYELLVDGLSSEPLPVTVEVNQREYSDQEAAAAFYRLMDGLEDRIRGENPSLMEVSQDLKLFSFDEETGVECQWQSSEPERLSSSGEIRESIRESLDMTLFVKLKAGTQEAEFEVPVRLIPPALTKQEQKLEQLRQLIRQADENQREEEYLELPKEMEGSRLSYRTAENSSYGVLPVLGVLAGILLLMSRQQEAQKAEKRREQALLLDHAEVVSKLMVFIGAGMTIRGAWERMVRDYESSGRKPERAVYEEMRKTYFQIVNGMPEGDAYREFGKRCRLQPYLKLSSLLEQNRKTGTKNLREILREEMEDAFELRKNLALRMGEEAGTKLLLPLFMMLGIVMVMIMVPAMMTMG